MGIHVTPMDWTDRFRRARELVSSQTDRQPSSDRLSLQSDAVAGGGTEGRSVGARRPANTLLDQREIRRHQLAVLGLNEAATVEDITLAHHRLVSDLTPGPDAKHGRVELALAMLEEVDQAYRWLKMSAVA